MTVSFKGHDDWKWGGGRGKVCASEFVLFVCLFLDVERCMWKGRMGELGEGTVSGRGKVRMGGGRWREGD